MEHILNRHSSPTAWPPDLTGTLPSTPGGTGGDPAGRRGRGAGKKQKRDRVSQAWPWRFIPCVSPGEPAGLWLTSAASLGCGWALGLRLGRDRK